MNIHCALRFNLSIRIRRNWQFVRNLQMHGAIITASEKFIDNDKKSWFRNWPLPPNFFTAHLYILVRCKTKGAVRVVCALLRIFPLSTQWPISVLDGPESLKGSQKLGDGRTLPLIKVYRMSLISAGSILLNSTFTTVQYCSFLFPFIFTSFVCSLFHNPQ